MLSPEQRHSTTWGLIEASLKERERLLLNKIVAPLGPEETAHLRGQIAEIRRVLSWGDPPDPRRDS